MKKFSNLYLKLGNDKNEVLKDTNLNIRNPFKKSDLLNYDIDSEEEWGELDGEDVDKEDNMSENGSSDDSECVNDGWLVDDDALLSESESFENG